MVFLSEVYLHRYQLVLIKSTSVYIYREHIFPKLGAMSCSSILNLYIDDCISSSTTHSVYSAEKLHVSHRVCLILHCTINDYMSATCGLLLIFFLLEKKRVEREIFQLFNYLPAFYFFRFC